MALVKRIEALGTEVLRDINQTWEKQLWKKKRQKNPGREDIILIGDNYGPVCGQTLTLLWREGCNPGLYRKNCQNGPVIANQRAKEWMNEWMFNISIAQISIWIWSNALYNSRGNQINIAQIIIFTIIIHKSNQMLVFDERRKPEYPGENLS